MSDIKKRLTAYAIAVVVVTVAIVWWELSSSRAGLEHDKSAMAWVGFLPFILPVFAAQALVCVAAVAAAIEGILGFFRWKGGE